VLANDFVKSLGRESRAQQVIRGFHCGFVRRFAYPNHLAYHPQAGPLMLLLEPIDQSISVETVAVRASIRP
jgi:hypothetical protein